MPLSHTIQSARELLVSIHAEGLTRTMFLDFDADTYSADLLSFEPNILDSWARGEYMEIAPQLLRPSLSNVDDQNFYLLREAIRKELAARRSNPFCDANALPDAEGWKFPTLTLDDGRVRVRYFQSISDCRNDYKTQTTVARYLSSEGWSDSDCRVHAEALSAQYDVPVFDIIYDSDEIARTFQAVHGSLTSCMTKPAAAYKLPAHLHPTTGHGLPGDLALAVLWNNDQREKITARCMVWPAEKIFSRCYGLSDKLANTLISQGWRFGNFVGANLAMPIIDFKPIEGRTAQITHLMPYLDTVHASSDNYSGHLGAAYYIVGKRGVFTHEGTAYIDLEVVADSGSYEQDGFYLQAHTTNHHSTGVASTMVYYYPGKDKVYVAERTMFAHLQGRAKPRRFDITELHELGYSYEDFEHIDGVEYDKGMLYHGEGGRYLTPRAVWNMNQHAPQIIFPDNTVVPRSECRMAMDTGQYARLEDLHFDALNREYRQTRLRYVATIQGGIPDRGILATAASMEHILDLLREKTNARLTLNQTDFDNGEVHLRVVDSRASNQPVRQVGSVAP